LSAPHPACYATAKEKGEVFHPPDYLAQVVAAAPGVPFNATRMAERVADASARTELADALRRSGVECLRNFYRANDLVQPKLMTFPSVAAPVLSLYGAKDRFVAPEAYKKSGVHVTGDFRIVVVPETAHYPHQEAPARVNLELEQWLENS
jgi:pimeloyl-ACP methyl ester carboxylesterase